MSERHVQVNGASGDRGSPSSGGATIIVRPFNPETFDDIVTGSKTLQLNYRNRPVELEIVDDNELLLRLDGVVRKRRRRDGTNCVYVWTNVELHWEEHHYIEARWWPATRRVHLTVNGNTLLDIVLPSDP